MQKNFFDILVQTALTVGLFWTILKLTPKSALLSFTILYYFQKREKMNLALLKSHSAPIHLEQIFDALLVGAPKILM